MAYEGIHEAKTHLYRLVERAAARSRRDSSADGRSTWSCSPDTRTPTTDLKPQPTKSPTSVSLHHIDSASAPGKIRTCDLSLRRRALYPLSYGRGQAQSIARPRPWLWAEGTRYNPTFGTAVSQCRGGWLTMSSKRLRKPKDSAPARKTGLRPRNGTLPSERRLVARPSTGVGTHEAAHRHERWVQQRALRSQRPRQRCPKRPVRSPASNLPRPRAPSRPLLRSSRNI